MKGGKENENRYNRETKITFENTQIQTFKTRMRQNAVIPNVLFVL
jgi:hypothetical protein